jgi:hypothetical protein
VAVSLTLVFVPMSGVITIIVVVVIGDIRKFATESLQFSLGYVFVSFMLSGNLRNAIT